MTASSETVEAPARPMTRCAAAIRAGRSAKNSAISTGKLIRAQAAATRALSSPRACWVRRIHCRSSGAQKRQRRRHDVGHDPRPLRAAGHQHVEALSDDARDRGSAAAAMTDGRTGLPVTRVLASIAAIDALQARKAAGDEVDAGAQETVGPAHHRVLLMQDARNPAGARRRGAAARSDSRRSRPPRAA